MGTETSEFPLLRTALHAREDVRFRDIHEIFFAGSISDQNTHHHLAISS